MNCICYHFSIIKIKLSIERITQIHSDKCKRETAKILAIIDNTLKRQKRLVINDALQTTGVNESKLQLDFTHTEKFQQKPFTTITGFIDKNIDSHSINMTDRSLKLKDFYAAK